MSIDDRIRAAIEATAATVREIPPLTMPDDLPGAVPPARPRRLRSRSARRGRGSWGTWLIPLAAAAAVIVVAAILVAVRDLPGSGRAAGTPASPGGVAGLPRYGVALTKGEVKLPGGSRAGVSDLSVIDTRTGKQVAVVKHPANVGFTAVSGAADDRTFAVTARYYTPVQVPGAPAGHTDTIQVWYLLRIAPGSSRPVQLTRLNIPAQPSTAFIDGIALSPDGRTLAVLGWSQLGRPGESIPATLRLYSVATGKAVRTWTGGPPPYPFAGFGDSYGTSHNFAGLTWLADGRTLAFTYWAAGQPAAVRTLDTTRAGHDLVAGSHRVFTLPASGPDACSEAMLTPDGRTVLCGTQPPLVMGPCGTQTLEIDAYSAATGKRERVLYRYTGKCTVDGIGALGWAGSADTVVAMVDAGTVRASGLFDDTKVITGVLVHGKLVPLGSGTLLFRQGPGTIAF